MNREEVREILIDFHMSEWEPPLMREVAEANVDEYLDKINISATNKAPIVRGNKDEEEFFNLDGFNPDAHSQEWNDGVLIEKRTFYKKIEK